MSVISSFYNTTFSTTRMVTTSGGRYSVPSGVVLSADCVIRPITEVAKLFNQNNWGKEYNLWCDYGLDIKPNDSLSSDGVDYSVQGVSPYEDLVDGIESHTLLNLYRKQ